MGNNFDFTSSFSLNLTSTTNTKVQNMLKANDIWKKNKEMLNSCNTCNFNFHRVAMFYGSPTGPLAEFTICDIVWPAWFYYKRHGFILCSRLFSYNLAVPR